MPALDSHGDLIEQVWRDLGGRLPRPRIAQAVAEAATRFEDARVTMYVPLFVRRAAREALAPEALAVAQARASDAEPPARQHGPLAA